VSSIGEAVLRVKAVYLEMPGTRLSRADLLDVSGLDPDACDALILALEDAAFLQRSGPQHFTLNPDSPIARPAVTSDSLA